MDNKQRENEDAAELGTGETCEVCHQIFDKGGDCSGNYVPLTREEEYILARMREVKGKVAEVKRQLQALESHLGFQIPTFDGAEESITDDQAQWRKQREQLDLLRQQWGELDRRRQAAASLRMKILGHED